MKEIFPRKKLLMMKIFSSIEITKVVILMNKSTKKEYEGLKEQLLLYK
jgi:hypothetical protein